MSQIDEIQTAASQLLNTLTGGTHDEMLSSRAYRMGRTSKRWDMVRRMIDAVFFWEPNHCKTMYEWENLNDC